MIRELAQTLRRRRREFPPRRARSRRPRLQGSERDQPAPRVRRDLQPGRHRAGAHERLVRQHARRHRRASPSLTGYEDEEPRISGMDVNYPDQIVSLFATGIVIAAVMEARRTGKGAFLDFSQREVASLHPGRGDRRGCGRSARATAPRGNAAGRRRPAGRLSLRRRALARRHARPGRSFAWRPSAPALRQRRRRRRACWRKRHRRRALQRRHRPAARHGSAGRHAGPRRARRPGEGPALPPRRQGHRHRASPRPISASTPTRCCASCWATTTHSLKQLDDSGVTSTTPTIGEV